MIQWNNRILTEVFHTCDQNLVILAWNSDHADSYRAAKLVIETHTDRQAQATTIPESQNWLRVKMCLAKPQKFYIDMPDTKLPLYRMFIRGRRNLYHAMLRYEDHQTCEHVSEVPS